MVLKVISFNWDAVINPLPFIYNPLSSCFSNYVLNHTFNVLFKPFTVQFKREISPDRGVSPTFYLTHSHKKI